MSGFTFGTPTTQAATKPSGITFGSFGTPQSSGNTTTPFSFSSPATTFASTTTASFSFGSSLTAASTTIATSTASQPSLGLSGFGGKPPTPSTSFFGLGTPLTTAAVAPTFGTPVTTTTTTPSFGFLAPTSSTNASVTAPSFGFGLTSKPSTTAAAAPSAGLSFGSSTVTSTSVTSSLAFGLKSTPATSTVASTAASSPFTLPVTQPASGGLTFGASATPITVATVVATSTSGLSFGGFVSAKSGTTTTPATTATTTPSGFSLGSLIKPSGSTAPAATATTATTSSAPTVTTAATVTTTAAATITTTTAVSSAALPSTATSLTYRHLEDMVNKWTYELEEQSRNFSAELNRLNKADGVLIANAEKISDLHAKVEACKAGQSRIEQELEFVESQQRTLEDLLEPLEQAAADLPPSQQHADVEREAIFQMCINTDLELGQLLGELREMAARVNAVTADLESTTMMPTSAIAAADGGTGATVGVGNDGDGLTGVKDKTTNVIGRVTRILNSHMHSLSWLSQNTQELMEKMKFLNTA